MKKLTALIVCAMSFIYFPRSGEAQVVDALSIISELSGALNQIEIFTSMDESLKAIENVQNATEKIKDASEWYNKMNHIKTMLVMVESSVCYVKDLDFLYQNYLGSVWTDWDGDGGCLTGLKYQMVLSKAEAITEMVSDLIESNELTVGERNMISLQLLEGIRDFVDASETFMTDMKVKIAMQQRFDEEAESFVTPSTMNTDKYDSASSIASSMLGGHGGLKGIADSIISMVLALSLIPILGGINNPEALRNGIISWAAALVIYVIFRNIIF